MIEGFCGAWLPGVQTQFAQLPVYPIGVRGIVHAALEVYAQRNRDFGTVLHPMRKDDRVGYAKPWSQLKSPCSILQMLPIYRSMNVAGPELLELTRWQHFAIVAVENVNGFRAAHLH